MAPQFSNAVMEQVRGDLDFERRVVAGEVPGIIPAGTIYVPKSKSDNPSKEANMAGKKNSKKKAEEVAVEAVVQVAEELIPATATLVEETVANTDNPTPASDDNAAQTPVEQKPRDALTYAVEVRARKSLSIAQGLLPFAAKQKKGDLRHQLRNATEEVHRWRKNGFLAIEQNIVDAEMQVVKTQLHAAIDNLWVVLHNIFKVQFGQNVFSVRQSLKDIEWSKGRGFWTDEDEKAMGDLRSRTTEALAETDKLKELDPLPKELAKSIRSIADELRDRINYNKFPAKVKALRTALSVAAKHPNRSEEMSKLLTQGSDLKAKIEAHDDVYPIPPKLFGEVSRVGNQLWDAINASTKSVQTLEERLHANNQAKK